MKQFRYVLITKEKIIEGNWKDQSEYTIEKLEENKKVFDKPLFDKSHCDWYIEYREV